MIAVVQVGESGEVHLPPEAHGWKPHTRLQLTHQGEQLVLQPANASALAVQSAAQWSSRSPAQRAEAFGKLIASLPVRQGPEIPDEALRRENIYD